MVTQSKQYVIIGGGPGGLQTAFYLSRLTDDYLILERGKQAGTFFTQLPISGELISINKPNTGSSLDDFNLRHDWNSLLNDNKVMFPSYSSEYYPPRKAMTEYLNDYAKQHALRVKYNSVVTTVSKDLDGTFVVTYKSPTSKKKHIVRCRVLFVCTGLSKANVPECIANVPGVYKYADMSGMPGTEFTNKKVLLIGNGNSAWEIANKLTPHASHILMLGRRPRTWSMVSHYTGDVRAKYLAYIDTFLLKSQNAIEHCSDVQLRYDDDCGMYTLQNPLLSVTQYDAVINCTGYLFDDSIFEFPVETTLNGKLPRTTPQFESTSVRNLYFTGALMHGLDYRVSSGGFIHGFRYLIQLCIRGMMGQPPSSYEFPLSTTRDNDTYDIVLHFLKRVNISSSLYQMHGEIGDVIAVDADTARYTEDVHMKSLLANPSAVCPVLKRFMTVTLEYSNEHVERFPDLELTQARIGHESRSALLHPIVRVWEWVDIKDVHIVEEIHFTEDLFAKFLMNKKYGDRFHRIVQSLRE